MQVTKVSIDFFQYEVMKDINIIMPEASKKKEKILFICISYDILDMDQCEKILATKDFQRRYNESKMFELNKKPKPWEVIQMIFSAKERIAVFPNVISLFRGNMDKFFFDYRNCFQATNSDLLMEKSAIESFGIHLSGKSLPYFYQDRLFKVSNPESLQEININSYSYSIKRMEKPYQDKCSNYKTTKQAAIADCIHNMFPGNTFYTKYDLIDENNPVYQNQTYKFVSYTDGKICENKYIQSHCNETIYFNQLDVMRKDDEAVYYETDFRIGVPDDDTSPSFIMESKARINIIDFITYIMGALGSWIGFSFLMINPIPFIFRIKDNAISDSEATPGSDQGGISNRNKLDSDRMKSKVRSIEYKLQTIDQRLEGMAQDMSQQRSAQEQINIATQQKLDQILRKITASKSFK